MFERFRTIQGKQLTLAILVSVIPLLLVGHLVNSAYIDKIREEVRSQLRQITSDKAQSIKQWIAERNADIHLLASTNYVKSLLTEGDSEARKEEFHRFYDKFARQYDVYRLIKVCDDGGQTVDSYPAEVDFDPGAYGSNPDDSAMSDAFLWNGNAHSLISMPVEEGPEIMGRIVVLTDLNVLKDITDNIQFGATGEAYIVNSSGYFVTHRHQHRILSENISDVEPISRLFSGGEESFVGEFVDYRGIQVLGAYYHFKDLGWGLIAEQDVEEAFAPAYETNRSILLLVLISSMVAAVAAYFLTARNLQPLRALKWTIQRIRRGELDVRFPVRQHDEIGITGEVFNRMLEQLQAAQEQLQQRVEAADRELVIAHRELQMRHGELKRAQERLLRTEKLSTMGEVAAGVAHEINNPLTTIKMLINSLGSADREDPEERKRALAIISEEIEKIAGLIGRFMDLTHPKEMRFEPIVIEKVIDRTLAFLRPKLEKGEIKVEVSIPQELPVVVGDEGQLGQSIMNLILNSIHAMPEGGKITFTAMPYLLKDNGRRYLRIQVSDTGCGIPDRIIDQIFNPFFTTRADGTGLGLSIVSRIIENHGGRVSVHSTPGVGTTFFIDLPESKEKA